MAVKVKKVVLYRRDLENTPGTLASALKPFAEAKHNLQIVMGYALPGDRDKAALEIYPVSGKKGETAAQEAGLEPMTHTSCLLVEGDDRVGLGYAMASALAEAGVNITFSVVQVVGRKFLGIFGFDPADVDKAMPIMKSAGKDLRKTASRKRVKKALAKVVKKQAGKRKPAKKTAAKKPAARKTAAKKTVGKKVAGKKVAGKKVAGKKKTTARKVAPKAKKPVARKKAKARK